MNFDVVLTNSAEADIDNSFQWYEKQDLGLGIEFIAQLDTNFNQIGKNPYQYPTVISQKIHRCLVNRFPYAIYFEVEDNLVTIFAILHQYRNPELMSSRIK